MKWSSTWSVEPLSLQMFFFYFTFFLKGRPAEPVGPPCSGSSLSSTGHCFCSLRLLSFFPFSVKLTQVTMWGEDVISWVSLKATSFLLSHNGPEGTCSTQRNGDHWEGEELFCRSVSTIIGREKNPRKQVFWRKGEKECANLLNSQSWTVKNNYLERYLFKFAKIQPQ